MFLLLSFIVLNSVQISAVSVVTCGADPSGKLDSTTAFEDCLRSMPTGTLSVPTGRYRISRAIVKNRNQNLVGSGADASVITCQITNSACIVAADTVFGPNNYTNSIIGDLSLEGPGMAYKSIGVLLGGDPSGRSSKDAFGDGVNLSNVRIRNFQHGIQWGNNAFENKLYRCSILGNLTGIYVPEGLVNSGEAIGISDTGISNNREYAIEDHSGFEWLVQGSSFDYNSAALLFFGGAIHISNSHFEQSASRLFFQPYGSAIFSIRDSEILIQARDGKDHYILDVWPQTLNVTVDDVSIWSNHPVQFFMHSSGNISGVITNLHGNGNRKIAGLSSAPNQVVPLAISAF